MYTTLFGEDRLSALEYAKLLIDIAYSRPIHNLHREPDLKHQISFRTYNADNNEKVSLHERPGIYMIFRKKFDVEECLYVGVSDSSIAYRLYRFIKELEDKSRDDESHPAAKKARKDGVKSTDKLYTRIIYKEDVFKNTDSFYHHLYNEIDEYIAFIMKARYNKLKRKW
jgi:hypothetical protein